MHFETKQHIHGTPEEVEQALLDDRYLDFLLKNHGVLVEAHLLERSDDGTRVRRKVRYLPKPVIKSIGSKPVPPEWFAFVENSTYDRAKKELVFSNIPASATISKLLVNTGTLTLKSSGDWTERMVQGEIALKLPFFLKPLAMIGERLIHSEGLKILAGEVPVLNRFIVEVLRK